MSRPKPKPKRRPPGYARLRRVARRYRSDSIDALSKSTVSLSLIGHEIKGLEKLARRHDTSLGVELHRAIDTHIRNDGQPSIQLLNTFLDRLNAALDRNNQALEKRLRKVMKPRTRS